MVQLLPINRSTAALPTGRPFRRRSTRSALDMTVTFTGRPSCPGHVQCGNNATTGRSSIQCARWMSNAVFAKPQRSMMPKKLAIVGQA